MKIKLYPLLLSLAILLLSSGIASAATPNLTISSSGNGIFTIYGSGMGKINGLVVEVVYDSSTLSNPQITFGSLVNISGAFSVPNPNLSSNSMRLATIHASQPFNQTGNYATITFNRLTSSPGKIISMSVPQATTPTGESVTVTTSIVNPAGSQQDTATSKQTGDGQDQTSTDTPSTDTNPTTTQGGWPGTVTLPSSDTSGTEKQDTGKQTETAGTPPKDVPSQEATAASGEQQPATGKDEKKDSAKEQFVANVSMIERFRQYEGERTPAKLLALLNETGKGYVQDPPILFTDGKSTVKVTIILPADTTAAPNVAISKEGQMVSFRRSDDGNWVVEIRPKKDVSQLTLTYFVNDKVTEIPLTVTPRLEVFHGKPFAKLTEADFVRFIAGRNAAKEIQLYDLNGDKKLNHIDDFIFSANYLLQAPPLKPEKESPPAKPAKESPAAKQQGGVKPAAAPPAKP